METKMIRVPFDIEIAKKITKGETEGRIVARGGSNARILCFDRKGTQMPIIALVEIKDGEEDYFSYYENGHYDICIHNSKDLMLEIPEYITFKDGDVLVSCEGVVLLFDGTVNQYDLCGCYCSLYCDSHDLDLNYDYKGVFHETRKANEDERNEMINKLKASKEPKAKEYLKRFFGIEEKKECEFKPFDKVLVRDSKSLEWKIDIFREFINDRDKCGYKYACFYDSWNYCIPYNEQTAHLLGTSDEYVK